MDDNLLLSGWNQFEIEEHEGGFGHVLPNLNTAILAILHLLVEVFLNCVFTLEQATESILDR